MNECDSHIKMTVGTGQIEDCHCFSWMGGDGMSIRDLLATYADLRLRDYS